MSAAPATRMTEPHTTPARGVIRAAATAPKLPRPASRKAARPPHSRLVDPARFAASFGPSER
ncbi:MAG TPA: hypothetical protein VFW65_24940 [Pseudonocardiaceae bacterium]|nr:hypothetical protein [Pseudonocardiaceae bacterium]